MHPPTLVVERLPLVGPYIKKNKDRFPKQVEAGNIVNGLPIPSGSCSAIYCSHVLEHLSLQDLRAALVHTYELLRNGGVFRLVVPDLRQLAENYISSESPEAAMTFMRESGLGKDHRASGPMDMIKNMWGNSEHLWMWDYSSLELELEGVGFVQVRRAVYGDSDDRMFDEVESEKRWENCLGIECKRL
jgi:predicted SAM-dependent methyltransferase